MYRNFVLFSIKFYKVLVQVDMESTYMHLIFLTDKPRLNCILSFCDSKYIPERKFSLSLSFCPYAQQYAKPIIKAALLLLLQACHHTS